MAISASAGPLIVWGVNPAIGNTPYAPDYNADRAPSVFDLGTMLMDPRIGYKGDLNSTSLATGGFLATSEYMVVDAVPATAATAAVAALQVAASGTPLTLVTSAAAGIAVGATASSMPQSGTVFPAGTLFVDSVPAMLTFGSAGTVACLDPRTALTRALSITGSSASSGGNMTIKGADLYGFPMTETIAAPAGATTVNGKKAFKAIYSVTPAFTDASHNYSVGTLDIIGLPLATYFWGQTEVFVNAAVVTASTGFVAAVVTDPATATTGDVRGTYAMQTISNGVLRVQISLSPAPYNMLATNGAASLFGIAQV